jgi:hypothetical protein
MGKMSDKHIEMQEEKIEIWDGEKFRDTTKEPIVHIDDWKSKIEESLHPFVEIVKEYGIHTFTNPDTQLEVGPLSVIWEMSTQAFDIPREIQIVIDDNGEIFIDVGTPGYVDFSFEPSGMKLPIMCWIHTHPMGSAFFSTTDWKTLNSWNTIMESAIVLGNNEFWAYDVKRDICKMVKYGKLKGTETKEEEE